MKLLHTFVLLIIGLLFAAPAFSVQKGEKPAWFDIEIILFAHGSKSAGSTESWPMDPGHPNWSQATTIQPGVSPPATIFDLSEEKTATVASPFKLLSNDQWRLTAEEKQLKRTKGRVEPLLHLAWRQPVLGKNKAIPIYLRTSETVQSGLPRLEGLITVSVQRYLHIDLDLLLNQSTSRLSSESESGLLLNDDAKSFRYTGTRKMRSSELHYMDHPKMGALILISRFEQPEPTEQERKPEQQPEETTEPVSEPTPQ
ncbi:MAG: hypothetical protein GY696_24875 [Gammaproteobacteria bacterium]|nr:hypothetical protein [Gammaproteobacteria bacterium]